jgi:hypothetical protein
VLDPAHMARQIEPPTVRIEKPEGEVSGYLLALSLGGGKSSRCDEPELPAATEHIKLVDLAPLPQEDGTVAFDVPREAWESLRSNFGYWWTVVAVRPGDAVSALRSNEIRCMIRHEPIARFGGSALRYPDQQHFPVVDLGASKQNGWRDEGALPARPALRRRKSGLWGDPSKATRHRRPRPPDKPGGRSA